MWRWGGGGRNITVYVIACVCTSLPALKLLCLFLRSRNSFLGSCFCKNRTFGCAKECCFMSYTAKRTILWMHMKAFCIWIFVNQEWKINPQKVIPNNELFIPFCLVMASIYLCSECSVELCMEKVQWPLCKPMVRFCVMFKCLIKNEMIMKRYHASKWSIFHSRFIKHQNFKRFYAQP